MRLRTVLPDRRYVLRNRFGRSGDSKLREEKAELVVVGGGELRLDVGTEIPESLLEGTECLLPCLVEELLIGIRRLPLVLCVLPQPVVDLAPQLGREAVVQHRLEVRREMNLRRFSAGKVVKRRVGESRSSVLHRSRETILLAR